MIPRITKDSYVCTGVCACMQRQEVDDRCLPLTLSALYFKTVSLSEAGVLSPGQAGCQQAPDQSVSIPTALDYIHMLLLLAFMWVLGSKLKSHDGPASSLPTKPSLQPS